MGCAFSCKILSSSSSSKESWTNMIRVVDLNGQIEYLDHPVMAGQVTGKPPTHLLFSHAQLLSNASSPLKLDALLEAGKVYFLLPHTLFNANVSPTELAPIVRKLLDTAASSNRVKMGSSAAASGDANQCPTSDPDGSNGGVLGAADGDSTGTGCKDGSRSRTRRRSWRPILSTIREISFNRRSESDLQKHEL